MKLTGRYFISGHIETLSGLHIGGNKSAFDIGGIDNPVIKTAQGVPYIPGSSLKGKLRSLLAWEQGSTDLKKDDEFDVLLSLFGKVNAGEEAKNHSLARLRVRDAFLVGTSKYKGKERHEEIKTPHDIDGLRENFQANFPTLDADFTEEKVENMIDRLSGTAKFPRYTERVPPGSLFRFELILDEYEGDLDNAKSQSKYLDDVKRALMHLQDNALGGSGSRGSGRISFHSVEVKRKKIDNNTYIPDTNFGTVKWSFDEQPGISVS